MFTLVRGGPKILLLETKNIDTLKEYLITALEAYEYNLSDAFEKAGEDYTIVFITHKIKDIVNINDIKDTLILKDEPDVVLCKLIKHRYINMICDARIAPRIIIVRAMGNMEKVLKTIKLDHDGSVGKFLDILNTHNDMGTLVALTNTPIHQNMSVEDLYERSLFIEERYYDLLKSLRLHALKYLNIGIGNKDWYELEIRIYDKYEEYKLHYERLLKLFEFLEIGIVLGESWGKDYPKVMLSVVVYRVRFFTFHDPSYIKKVLFALEYLADGTRVVDYDVYLNRRKLYWSDVLKRGKKSRDDLGVEFREEIFSQLNESERKEMIQLEEDIIKTRY